MTAQLGNIVKYKKEAYTIIQNSNIQPFHPEKIGLKLSNDSNSCCWDGYISEYAINEDKKIILENLFIDLKSRSIKINGVNPINTADVFGKTVEAIDRYGEKVILHNITDKPRLYYKNVDMFIDYTGEIIIGKNCVHIPFTFEGIVDIGQYKIVYKLVFNNGILVDVFDMCEESALNRENLLELAECFTRIRR